MNDQIDRPEPAEHDPFIEAVAMEHDPAECFAGDRGVLDRRDLARPRVAAGRPEHCQVVGLGAPRGEHDLQGPDTQQPGDLLPGAVEHRPGPPPRGVDGRRVPDRPGAGHRGGRRPPQRAGGRMVQVDALTIGPALTHRFRLSRATRIRPIPL